MARWPRRCVQLSGANGAVQLGLPMHVYGSSLADRADVLHLSNRSGKERSERVRTNRNQSREWYRPACSLLVGPHRHRSTDNRGCREGSKVSTVERVRGLPIHDKDITVGNDVASLPGRKRTAVAVAFVCISDVDAVDGDRQAVS